MTPVLVCLATVLCLFPASVLSQSKAGECQSNCRPHHDRGFLCTLQNRCTPPLDSDAKGACYARCMSLYHRCLSVCQELYNSITVMCQANCSGASPSCVNECFLSKLKIILRSPTKREVSIWQTVPVLGRQRREAVEDSTERVSPRDDSKRSWDSSEEVDDIFEIWRMKRDTKRSTDSTSSMDLDDFLENWRNKRDSKRSPGSTSSGDVGEIFGVRRRSQDWTWEEGNLENDVYGDWKDKRSQDWSWEEGNLENDVYGDWKYKRQAETEIQQQKQ